MIYNIDMNDFKLKMAELLEVETVENSDKLESFECWILLPYFQ
jgi:hypothetical protein